MNIARIGALRWAIPVVVIVIGFSVLGFTQNKRAQERSELTSRLSAVEATLDKVQVDSLLSRHGQLKSELADTESQFLAAQEQLSGAGESIELTSVLFRVAKDSQVQIESLNESGLTSEVLVGVDMLARKASIRASGTASDLLRFITGLNNGFKGGLVESAQLVMEDSDKALADIQMTIYEYEGR